MNVKTLLGSKSAEVITIQPEKSLLEASQLLTQHNIGAVVVVNAKGKPIGILSERDIVRQMSAHGASVTKLSVADAMTEDIIIGLLDDDLSAVSNVMTNNRIRHLPIMDNQNLIGIVSIGDVVKAQLNQVENEAHSLRQYITGGYN